MTRELQGAIFRYSTPTRRGLLSAGTGALLASAVPPPARSQTSPAPTEADVRYATGLEAIADVTERLADAVPDLEFDARAVAATLPAQPGAVRDWVHEHVLPSPYEGALRGPVGTLHDRRGSSLDLALLTAKLLELKGWRVRIACAPFDDAGAAAFVARSGTPLIPVDHEPDVKDALVQYAREPRLLYANLEERMKGRDFDTPAALSSRVESRAVKLARDIGAAVGGTWNGRAMRPGFRPATRWWAEVESGGAWTPVDPSHDVGPTPAASGVYEVGSIPAGEWHSVLIRLVATVGTPASDVVLVQTEVRVADHDGRPIAFDMMPLGADLSNTAGPAALDKIRAFVPTLAVRDRLIQGRILTLDGETPEATSENLGKYTGASNAVAGFGAALSMLGGGAGGSTAGGALRTNLRSVRMEFAVRSPGIAPPAEERWLLFPRDRALGSSPGGGGSEPRSAAALSMLKSASIVVWGATPSADVLTKRIGPSVARALRRAAAGIKDPGAAAAGAAYADRGDPVTEGFARARASGSERIDVIAPNVAATWIEFAGTPSDPRSRAVFDIISNATASVGASDAPASRLLQGVRDSVAEAEIMGGPSAGSAAAAMEADLADGRPWTRIADALEARKRGAKPATVALMESAMLRGHTILAPQDLGDTVREEVFWWDLDPSTGSVLGRDGLGRGATLAEWTNISARMLQVGTCAFTFGASLGKIIEGRGYAWALRMGASVLCMGSGAVSGLGTAAKAFPKLPIPTSEWWSASSGVLSSFSGILGIFSLAESL